MHPKKGKDFDILYNELEVWRLNETKKIKGSQELDEEEKRLALQQLLHKETKILQQIDRLKIQVMVHNGAAFCLECNKVILIGDCSHSIKSMVDISGSDFRSSLKAKSMFNLADPEMQKSLLKGNIEMFEK